MTYRCLLLLMLLCLVVQAEQPSADLILINGKIWIVDPKLPEAQAVAIIGERIVAVGSSEEINSWPGPRTQVMAAKDFVRFAKSNVIASMQPYHAIDGQTLGAMTSSLFHRNKSGMLKST